MEIIITAPELLTEEHILQPFECGNEVLSDWLRRRAMKNQLQNAFRTFVICLEGTKRVVGYSSIATGSVSHAELGKASSSMTKDIFANLLAFITVFCYLTIFGIAGTVNILIFNRHQGGYLCPVIKRNTISGR